MTDADPVLPPTRQDRGRPPSPLSDRWWRTTERAVAAMLTVPLGEWVQVHCENGWEAWVNGALLVPVR